MDIERLKSAIERVKNAWKREYKTSEVIEARDILIDLAQQVIDGTIVECPCIKCSMDVKAKRNWACKACAISCPKDKLPSQKMMSEEEILKIIWDTRQKGIFKTELKFEELNKPQQDEFKRLAHALVGRIPKQKKGCPVCGSTINGHTCKAKSVPPSGLTREELRDIICEDIYGYAYGRVAIERRDRIDKLMDKLAHSAPAKGDKK